MATCGFQMPGQQKRYSKNPILEHPKRSIRLFPVLCKRSFLVFLVLLMGCAPTLKYGSPPRVGNLASLDKGVSTKADVLLALGEPRGKGAVRFSEAPSPWEIWFYEYIEGKGGRIDLKLLLIFFADKYYDGNLWFSAKQLLDKEE